MNFNQAVEYLLSLGHETLAIKLGLRNIELLLGALGNPERAYSSVQIAGTNGKGSTAVVLDSICRNTGTHTGLYTSPHLVSITERIRIDGADIQEDVFARHATSVRNAAETLLAQGQIQALPTFFEQVTAIALLAFKEANVDVAILETGLGGRLDATTAAGARIVAITQIAMDHEEYLGNSLSSIASEKAAIIRPSISAVIVADHQPSEALAAIKQQCEDNKIRPAINECAVEVKDVADGRFCVTFKTPTSVYDEIWLGLRGEHQIDNVAVAIQLAEIVSRSVSQPLTKRAVEDGVASARHAGRLEQIRATPEFLLDGAHNPAGASALRQHLERFVKQPITMIFGAMRDKQLNAIGDLLFPIANLLVLTSINNPRTADVVVLQEHARHHLSPAQITLAGSSAEALQLASNKTPENGLICVTGSLYLIGEVRPLILRTTDLQVA